MARLLAWNEDPDATLDLAATALQAGQCVAIPTETVYGLAADATQGKAVARIFEIKGRPRFNPLICHVASLEMARQYGQFSPLAERLAEHFWPGPLTLVVPRVGFCAVSELATAGLDTLGLRLPDGPARAIIARVGRPLAAPSANRSGRISPTTARHVLEEYPHLDLLVVDAGPSHVGLESTIVKVEADRLVLLRPGAVTAQALQQVAGVRVDRANEGGPIEAPGMLASHYAPDSRLLIDVESCPAGAALLAFGHGRGRDRSGASRILNLSESADLREAAANLYGMMKELDAARPELIAVERIPQSGLGDAIRDRLRRAAAPREKT